MTRELARQYLSARRWAPIPVPFRSKKPTIPGWSSLRLEAIDLAAYFDGNPSNIGVLLGVPSGGLVDVDLDCVEAVRLAPAFLPPTHSRFANHDSLRVSLLLLSSKS